MTRAQGTIAISMLMIIAGMEIIEFADHKYLITAYFAGILLLSLGITIAIRAAIGWRP